MNETRAVARLPSLDVEITHRRESEAETLQMTLRGAPGLEMLAHGQLALWTAMAMTPLALWQAWLAPFGSGTLPDRPAGPRRGAKVIPIDNRDRQR
jgi:hypothetical protein